MITTQFRTLFSVLLVASLLLSACGKAAPTHATIVQPTAIPTSAPTPLPTTLPPTALPPTALPPTLVPTPTRVPMDALMKGISFAQWDQGGFASQASDKLLQQSIPQMGATWIALIVTCQQTNISATTISCANSASDADVTHAIQTAHAAGLRVMLKPHLDLSADFSHWRGEIGQGFNPSKWKTWFESYTTFITHYASMGQAQGVEAFVVGTEMVTPSAHDKEWRTIVQTVRAQYSGLLTYAAIDNEFSLTWWDALDLIGVDAYYPLSASAAPTPAQLVSGWQPVAAKLEALSKRWGKPILFTEIGYQSMAGVSSMPTGVSWSHLLDLQAQADCYAAAFQVFSEKPWWRGAFWWVMDTNAAQGGVYDKGFSPLGKPAEAVLRQNYGASPSNPAPAPVFENEVTIEKNLPVYEDYLLSGWEDWSWGVEANPQFADQPYAGTRSIALTFHADQWDTLSLHHEPLDLSGYTWLEFYIWSENEAYAALRVELVSAEDVSYFWQPLVFDPQYIEGGQRLAGKWQRVRIPLSALGPENPKITRLNFFLDGQAEIKVRIDQIRFLKTK